MRQLMGLVVLIFIGAAIWRIGSELSPDALGMAVGVLFGVLGGLPTALLLMASQRRRADEERADVERRRRAQASSYGGYSPGYAQPPVIVLAGPGMQPSQQGNAGPYQANPYQQPMQRALPAQDAVDVRQFDVRQFKVVGEKEEWIDEW